MVVVWVVYDGVICYCVIFGGVVLVCGIGIGCELIESGGVVLCVDGEFVGVYW